MKRTFAKNAGRLLGAAGVAAALAGARADVNGILTTGGDGRPIAGTIRYLPASKQYVVTKDGVPITLEQRQVAEVSVQRPETFDAAVQQVGSGENDKAIPVLELIMKDYEMLQWDIAAAPPLARAYLKAKDPKKAVAALERVKDRRIPDALARDFQLAYWTALSDAGMNATLRKLLSDAIATGSRSIQALAQLTRGDLERKEGNFRDALVEGYLRTVVLFADEKTVQPEALYWSVKCFEQLGQPAQAEKMRKKLFAEYPSSPYSEQLRSGS